MYISLNWLREFVELPSQYQGKNLDPTELGELITLKTAEVEQVIEESEAYANMVTGQVVEVKKHPDADKLKVAKVTIGEKEDLQIVCGGANLQEGMYVAITLPGSKVRWHGEGDLIEVKKTKIRGVESTGMIAASSEIGLNNPEEGPEDILDLSANKPKPGTPLAEFLQKNDILIEIDNKSLTHRPDLWGHHGIAREVAVLTGGKFQIPEPKVKIPETGEKLDVKIEDHNLCPRFCGLIIKNVKVQDSPAWIQDRLRAVGHSCFNNIVDVTNYVMEEVGQPMHAFDKATIEGGLIIRMANKGEKLKTLDGNEHELNDQIGVVADYQGASSVAGVIGGDASAIKETTTEIILEAANWHPTLLRRASIALNTRTDAVQRFEKSLDPSLASRAILRAAEIILEICPGAEIAGPMTDEGKWQTPEKIITLDPNKARRKIGVEINDSEIKEILESLEFEVVEKTSENSNQEGKSKTSKLLEVKVPTFRATKDVNIDDDLIEEVVRIYGYDKVPDSLPDLPILPPTENTERRKMHEIRRHLSLGQGFDEVYNYSFYGQKEIKNALLTEDHHVKVLNYLSEDQTHMRVSLVPNILKNLQENIKFFPEIRIYELGRSYQEIGQYYPLEEKKLGLAILKKPEKSKTNSKNQNSENTNLNSVFYELKGAVESLLALLKVPKYQTVKDIDNAPYAHTAKALTYLDHKGKNLAKVFGLHPLVERNFELQGYDVALAEINLSEIYQLPEKSKKYQQISRFPSIEIDISVVVDKKLPIGDLHEAIQKAGIDFQKTQSNSSKNNTNQTQTLIKNIELFDLYEGPNIEDNKKAVAFKVILQSPERTLTDEEMSAIQGKIFQNLESLGGYIRGKN